MDTTSIYPYEYFLETQGIDVATGQRDLQNLFGRSGGRYLIELRSIRDRRGFYIRANMDLSRDLISRLEGHTPTPLERLQKIERRRVTPEAGCAAASAHRASRVGTSPAAGYQTHGSSDSGPTSQLTYSQFPMPTPASSHRRESDPGDRWHRAGGTASSLTRPTYAPDRSAGNTYSYAASQYYHSNSHQQEYDEGARSSDPPPPPPNAQHPEEDVSQDAGVYDATNDAFFFPTNSVSALAIQRRRETLNGMRGAVDR